jgi:hypothetical protein
MSNFRREILGASQCAALEPALLSSSFQGNKEICCYQYFDDQNGWRFSIATFGQPGSGQLSLGGFRIVPEARATPGFNPSREAIGLGIGMEEKVYWSRLIRVGGPLGQSNIDKIVGGKCVLLPTKGARVGEADDFKALDFAIACCKDFEQHSGVFLTTGQDLGHGQMSDGKTASLQYLNTNFRGSVISDTSKPTGEGNLQMLLGCLRGAEIETKGARVGLIGVGNIGVHLLERLRGVVGEIVAIEGSPLRQKQCVDAGVKVFAPDKKAEFLALPLDALAVNANGGSLDSESVSRIVQNGAIKIITGCENLVMPNSADSEVLRKAQRIFTPTEMCGMMGYLTAVEEFLSRREGKSFNTESMFEPARKLAQVGERGTARCRKEGFSCSFEEAVAKEFS